MHRFKVEVANRETGKRESRLIDAPNEQTAAETAMREGWLVGKTTLADAPAPPPRIARDAAPPRAAPHPHAVPWAWFAFGLVVGAMMTAGIGGIVIGVRSIGGHEDGERVAAAAPANPRGELGAVAEASPPRPRVQRAQPNAPARPPVATEKPIAEAANLPEPEWWHAAWFPARPNPSFTSIEYNRFDDFTEFSTKCLWAGFEVMFWTFERGDALTMHKPPDAIGIRVYKADEESAIDLAFIVDGRRMIPKRTGSKGWEWAYFELPVRDFLELVNGARVEGRVNFREFEVSKGELGLLADLASHLRP